MANRYEIIEMKTERFVLGRKTHLIILSLQLHGQTLQVQAFREDIRKMDLSLM